MRNVEHLILLLFLLIPVAPTSGIAKDFEVSGEVLDVDNRPINDQVSVIVWRGTTFISEARSNGGKYSVKFGGGGKIRITYEESKFAAASVDDISGERDHSIKKVLLPANSKLSPSQASQALSAYDLILNERTKTLSTAQLRDRYGLTLQKLIVPSQLNDQRVALLKRYGVEPSSSILVAVEGTIRDVKAKGNEITVMPGIGRAVDVKVQKGMTNIEGVSDPTELKAGQKVSVIYAPVTREAKQVEVTREK